MNKVKKAPSNKSTNQRKTKLGAAKPVPWGTAGPSWDPAFLPLTSSRPLSTLVLLLGSLSLPSGKVLIILQISTPLYNYLDICLPHWY